MVCWFLFLSVDWGFKNFERQKKFIEKDSFHADGLEPKAVLV